jgi:DnaJ-class molecular chaperone
LERDGRVFGRDWYQSYYTEAGMIAARAEHEERDHIAMPDWPMLGLSRTATRKQVMSAFRQRARELHPDVGGDAAEFRNLVAEKDRALGLVA